MGKSPGKWIKSVLFRKKHSNSSLPKRQDILLKSSHEKESPAPHQAPVNNVVVQPCFISAPVLVIGAAGYENKELESGRAEITAVSNVDQTVTPQNKDGDARETLNHDYSDVSENYKLEQAATKAQATFRGYRARRAFWTLKAIIRLQAVIRGHLVRRQAVATLNCILGIVKLQALARGRMVRHSDLSSQIHAKQTLSRQDAVSLDLITFGRGDKLEKNAFTRQLLSFTSSAMPLRLTYDPEEPNSAWNWLLRWTMSKIWGTVIVPKSKLESQRPVSKLNGAGKQPVNVDKPSGHPTSELEKVKCNLRPNEIDKGEFDPKKVSKSVSDIPHQAEVSTDKQRHGHKKSSNTPVPEMARKKPKNPSNKATKFLQGVAPDSASQEKYMMESAGEDVISDSPDKQLINETQDSKEDLLGKENHKISKRRASLPAKHDDQETLQPGTKVPSYMAATKSAKAKVRGQSSPRFGQEEVNGPARRYSLPSSVNAKPTSSPRVQRLVQSSGKAGIRIDRSLSSSRDSIEKIVQPEWKR